ncbi:hypothetical protein CB0940_03925 [Cercospora beticola]|uniref:F-box domain-containing protein n=1 Tax=Cercospora beticola TaxID=122368 RepID=A0A2G5HLR0_CERBT|nr:hypothetical protein CB0940_03925 [Cercospora beticola]PIA93448.1 hypothetical protein CB0940_03925 [Cercospora beticola]WPB01127.1 hypothetical protein RHO25_005748 [Cercospora beticola]
MSDHINVQWRGNPYAPYEPQVPNMFYNSLYEQVQSRQFGLDIAELRKLWEQAEALETGLSKSLALLEDIPGTSSVTATQPIRLELEKARANTKGLRTLINKLSNLAPPLFRPTSGAAASKVFQIPELLEHILTYSPTRQKLKCMLVQRRWHDTILGSTKLKRLLGLESSIDGFYYSPFSDPYHYNAHGFTDKMLPSGQDFSDDQHEMFEWEHLDEDGCNYDQALEYDESEVFLHGDFCIDEPGSQKTFGSRVGDMRICSSPVPVVQVFTSFSCGSSYADPELRGGSSEIHAPSSEGFTVGSLHDALTELLEKHKNCDWQRFCGYVSWDAVVHMREDDPLFIERRERKVRCLQERAEYERREQEREEQEALEQYLAECERHLAESVKDEDDVEDWEYAQTWWNTLSWYRTES